ncbi:hypothetical protein B0T16DRAFT_384862 [Cercophora newfieldiana]|uniref:Uncharacterized protein n=1 Tax=Cercophora newfieldiana TaxID=92897 RepID=A0AA39YQY0_9PEZI|nr:hypothetical protein B0T16DRAFT_384862 [Cercophora newfieldiana]
MARRDSYYVNHDTDSPPRSPRQRRTKERQGSFVGNILKKSIGVVSRSSHVSSSHSHSDTHVSIKLDRSSSKSVYRLDIYKSHVGEDHEDDHSADDHGKHHSADHHFHSEHESKHESKHNCEHASTSQRRSQYEMQDTPTTPTRAPTTPPPTPRRRVRRSSSAASRRSRMRSAATQQVCYSCDAQRGPGYQKSHPIESDEDALPNLFQGLKELFQGVKQFLKGFFQGFKRFFQSALNSTPNGFGDGEYDFKPTTEAREWESEACEDNSEDDEELDSQGQTVVNAQGKPVKPILKRKPSTASSKRRSVRFSTTDIFEDVPGLTSVSPRVGTPELLNEEPITPSDPVDPPTPTATPISEQFYHSQFGRKGGMGNGHIDFASYFRQFQEHESGTQETAPSGFLFDHPAPSPSYYFDGKPLFSTAHDNSGNFSPHFERYASHSDPSDNMYNHNNEKVYPGSASSEPTETFGAWNTPEEPAQPQQCQSFGMPSHYETEARSPSSATQDTFFANPKFGDWDDDNNGSPASNYGSSKLASPSPTFAAANPSASFAHPKMGDVNSTAWEVNSVQEAEIEAYSARLRCVSPI